MLLWCGQNNIFQYDILNFKIMNSGHKFFFSHSLLQHPKFHQGYVLKSYFPMWHPSAILNSEIWIFAKCLSSQLHSLIQHAEFNWNQAMCQHYDFHVRRRRPCRICNDVNQFGQQLHDESGLILSWSMTVSLLPMKNWTSRHSKFCFYSCLFSAIEVFTP